LEFLIASGDSGGGLFIDNKLAGIHSCVMTVGKNPQSKYGEESGHTRISNFIEWIEDNRKK
jgi:secreted trypsin-like serine protease